MCLLSLAKPSILRHISSVATSTGRLAGGPFSDGPYFDSSMGKREFLNIYFVRQRILSIYGARSQEPLQKTLSESDWPTQRIT